MKAFLFCGLVLMLCGCEKKAEEVQGEAIPVPIGKVPFEPERFQSGVWVWSENHRKAFNWVEVDFEEEKIRFKQFALSSDPETTEPLCEVEKESVQANLNQIKQDLKEVEFCRYRYVGVVACPLIAYLGFTKSVIEGESNLFKFWIDYCPAEDTVVACNSSDLREIQWRLQDEIEETDFESCPEIAH